MKEKTAAQDKVLRTNQVKNWIDNDNVSPNLMCQFRDGGMYFALGEGGGREGGVLTSKRRRR